MKKWVWKRVSDMKEWIRKRIAEMKNWVWKHRIGLALLIILMVQTPFVIFKMIAAEAAERDSVIPFLETAQILVSSGLAGYLFSKAFESLLENWLYGSFRRNWKEVRVMYSDGFGKGTGDVYPRDPTLLIQAPIWEDSKPESPRHTSDDSLFARRPDGSNHCITAPIVHGPMLLSFNSAYVGQPADGENTWVTGRWSELQLMQVGFSGHRVTRVGFPDTLTALGKVPAPDPD